MIYKNKKYLLNNNKSRNLKKKNILNNNIMSNNILFGLNNIGNTCFLNSVLHIIKHIDIIIYELICQRNDNEFMLKISLFYKVLFKRNFSLQEIRSFHSFLKKHIILEDIGIQGDSNEVIISLLSKLTDNNKTIDKVLRSKIINSVICNNCNNISNTSNYSYCFNYTIPTESNDTINLKDLIKLYSEQNDLFGNDSYNCEKCKKLTNAKKNQEVDKYAHILVMCMDRYIYNNNRGEKNNRSIMFPKKIELGDRYYNLIGTIYHFGHSIGSGHYICKVYDFNSSKWYIYNDSNISIVNEETEEISKDNYLHIYISDKMYNLCQGKIKESLKKVK